MGPVIVVAPRTHNMPTLVSCHGTLWIDMGFSADPWRLFWDFLHIHWMETSFVTKQNKRGVYFCIMHLKNKCQRLQTWQPLCDMHSQVADWVGQVRCSRLANRRCQMTVWLVNNAFGSTYVEGHSSDFIGGTVSVFAWRNKWKQWHFTQTRQAEIWTHMTWIWHMVSTYCIVTSGAKVWVGDNIKVDLGETEHGSVDWTQLVQDMIHDILCMSWWILWHNELIVEFAKRLHHEVNEKLLIGQFACRQFMSSRHVAEKCSSPCQ
jgi:hypothetical protein